MEGPLEMTQEKKGSLAQHGKATGKRRKVTRFGGGQVCSHVLALLGLSFLICQMEIGMPTSQNQLKRTRECMEALIIVSDI